MNDAPNKHTWQGILLAVLAALLWSGNFIVARAVNKQVPPVSLNFFRWLVAAIVILPFAVSYLKKDWPVIKRYPQYFIWASLTGVALFNTFVYVGAHYTSAINLALIGTTSSPIMSILFARIFLKEKIGTLKLTGLLLCITGVLVLLSKGKAENLLHLSFGEGDLWVLLAAFCFSVYNTLVKKKPSGITHQSFLFTTFFAGTLMVLPFSVYEFSHSGPMQWNATLILSILYLGIIASVVCFYIWNIAIGHLGAGRTALFGNLIPVFSCIEAVLLLHEPFTVVHVISMTIVFLGIAVANWPAAPQKLYPKAGQG